MAGARRQSELGLSAELQECPSLAAFEPAVVTSLRRRLLKWYKKHGRPLPWRLTADPYKIWISEIMLQQTTVKAVVPYFERFVARFPDVQSLANASESEVLQLWEGLGYYSRGRNLRKAAQVICENFSGTFPNALDDLQSLPGVGRYTAGAVRSFAFQLPAPIVEANTLRLYARLLGYEADPRSTAGQKVLWAFAELLQPQREAGELNQALMELGSQVCTPVSPRCPECPLQSDCLGFAQGTQLSIPMAKARPEITDVLEATVAIRSGEQFLFRQRSEAERWSGMWDFVRFPLEGLSSDLNMKLVESVAIVQSAIRLGVNEHSGIAVSDLELVHEIRHSVTRYRIRLLCFTAQCETPSMLDEKKGVFRWGTLQEFESQPMPVSGRQFLKFIQKQKASRQLF